MVAANRWVAGDCGVCSGCKTTEVRLQVSLEYLWNVWVWLPMLTNIVNLNGHSPVLVSSTWLCPCRWLVGCHDFVWDEEYLTFYVG